jgi:TorA maturation chaperone TorD
VAPPQLDVNLARARLIEVCSRLLLLELDADTRDALRHPGLLGPFNALEPGFDAWLGHEPWESERSDEADADFCELFLMGKHTSPCASAWIGDEPAVIGAAFHEHVDGWCDDLHLTLSDQPLGRVPRDHVAVLSGLLAHALLHGDAGARLADEIITHGLAPWLSRFVAAVLANTDNPLYRATVRLLEMLVLPDEPVSEQQRQIIICERQ